MSTVPLNQISFVVQGPIDRSVQKSSGKPTTQASLESVRQWCPGSEIVLSTWECSDVTGLTYDVLVTSPDPGAYNFMLPGAPRVNYANGNRQIVSTAAGLTGASCRYAVKMRSDLVLRGTNWLAMWDKFPARVPEWKIFQERVITSNLFTRNPLRELRKPFHPSDWFMFGLREDLLLLWDVELEPEPESAYWFRTHPHPREASDRQDTRRFYAEQYLWKTLLQKHGDIHFEHFADASPENIRLTELTFANNLIVLNLADFPLLMEKYERPSRPWVYSCISHTEWTRLYRRYCLEERVSPVIDRMTDWRHWYELFYLATPWKLRQRASKFLADRRQLASSGRPGAA